jgi:hypothetical protein
VLSAKYFPDGRFIHSSANIQLLGLWWRYTLAALVNRRVLMKTIVSALGLVALVSWSALYGQGGKLSDQEFSKLAASHANADEHQKLMAHYTAHAAEHEADAKLHEQLANQYAKTEPSLAGEARHYAAHSREAAEALRELAKIHQTLAKEHSSKK